MIVQSDDDTVATETMLCVQLKNDMKIEGVLKEIDANMNLKLDVTQTRANLPAYMQNLSTVYVRGSSIRYITLDKVDINKEKMEKMTNESRDLL